jgi:excisionase family DNA binding protein
MNGLTDSGTSILAREIAQELARVLRREPEGGGNDPKRLGDVQPALLNIHQAAKYLGRTVKGIRDLVTKGVLVRVRFDRKRQFKRRDLDDLIEKYTG